jgi:RTX calcium-binding nonapeptide repeat (4 copies)
MRRTIVLLASMALTLLVASGVALAVTKIGTDGPNTLKGTNGADNLIGKGGNDVLFALAGNDNLLGGAGKDEVLGGDERNPKGGNKNLVGGPGNDVVATGFGSDKAVGGTGNDLLFEEKTRGLSTDTYSGDPGNDVFLVNNKPANKDIVACGSGFDRVLADSKDVVASDCEQVSMNLSDKGFFETVPQSFFEGLPPPPSG